MVSWFGGINPHGVGYIYGFVDAALQILGQDIRDDKIGPPTLLLTFRLFSSNAPRIVSDERMILFPIRLEQAGLR